MRLQTVLPMLLLGVCTLAAGESQPRGVPPAAVKVDDNTWRYTDPQGKKWVYRRTPFGIMKTEETAETKKAAPIPPTKVVEDGEQLHFARQTPFGIQRWSRKKSELNEEERRIWENFSAKKQTPPPPAEERKK